MMSLRDHAADYLSEHINSDSVFKIIHAALQLNLNRLAKKACEYVKLNVPENESVGQFLVMNV
jgi:hypothetical protein